MEKIFIVVEVLLCICNSRANYIEHSSSAHLERISQEILVSRYTAFNTFCLSQNDSCMQMLPNLTRHFVFTHVTQIPALIEFVKHLPSIEISSIAYSALLEDFTHFYLLESQYLVQLMLLVKQTMQKIEFENIDDTYKNLYLKLKSKFPDKLIGLIWSDMGNCTIKNVKYEEEFLYTTSVWHNFGTRFRANYLWKYDIGDVKDETVFWRFKQHGDKLQMYNKHFWTFCLAKGGTLLSSLDNPETCEEFYLHPVGDMFRLSRESDSGFVSAGEVVNYRRRVRFVDNSHSEDSLWNISCTEYSTRRRF